jgi:predicted GTPase
MGYGEDQQRELEETIRRSGAEVVVIGTPIDLAGLIALDVPSVRAFYDLEELEGPSLSDLLASLTPSR